MNLDIKLTAHTKLIWSWIIDLNVAVRTIKLLGENIDECFLFFIFLKCFNSVSSSWYSFRLWAPKAGK